MTASKLNAEYRGVYTPEWRARQRTNGMVSIIHPSIHTRTRNLMKWNSHLVQLLHGIDDSKHFINKWEKFCVRVCPFSFGCIALACCVAHFNRTNNAFQYPCSSERTKNCSDRSLCGAPFFASVHSRCARHRRHQHQSRHHIPRAFHVFFCPVRDMFHVNSTAYQCHTRTCSYQFHIALQPTTMG